MPEAELLDPAAGATAASNPAMQDLGPEPATEAPAEPLIHGRTPEHAARGESAAQEPEEEAARRLKKERFEATHQHGPARKSADGTFAPVGAGSKAGAARPHTGVPRRAPGIPVADGPAAAEETKEEAAQRGEKGRLEAAHQDSPARVGSADGSSGFGGGASPPDGPGAGSLESPESPGWWWEHKQEQQVSGPLSAPERAPAPKPAARPSEGEEEKEGQEGEDGDSILGPPGSGTESVGSRSLRHSLSKMFKLQEERAALPEAAEARRAEIDRELTMLRQASVRQAAQEERQGPSRRTIPVRPRA